MKLISEITNDLVNDRISLTVALGKTKILAARIGNEDLLKWADLELKGYPNWDSVPMYRSTQGTVIGNFINGGYSVKNYPLPLPEFGDDMDDKIRSFRTVDSVSSLESFFKEPDRELKDSLVFPFNDGLRASLEDIMRNSNGPYFQLLSAGVKVPFNFATSVLSAVKNKLLDFMIEIEREFGMESDLSELRENSDKITYIMNNTINTNGDGNIVNTGANSSISATIKITKGNKDQLVNTLKENGVENDDIAELLTVIDTEKLEGDGFGVKVNSWIKKMLSKSLDGTWQVGIGAAGSLLADVLKAYYG